VEERVIGFTKSWNFTALEDLRNTSSYGLFSGINLDYCGTEKCEAGHSYGPAIRHSYLIHVVLDGAGIFKAGGKEYTLHKNQAFFIYPGTETFYQADKEKPWSYVWMGLHGYLSEECLRKIGLSTETPVIGLRDTKDIEECVTKLLEAPQLTYSNYLIRQGEMYRFFGLMMDQSENLKKDRQRYDYPQSIYVKQAVQFMSLNYEHHIKIDSLADQIGITRSYLTKSFQKELQTSPQEFLINLRLEKAAKLLLSENASISEISDAVGYSDPLAFSKKFKEKFGLSPKAYREAKPTLVLKNKKGEYISKAPL